MEDGDDEVAEVPEKQTQAASKIFSCAEGGSPRPQSSSLNWSAPSTRAAPHGQQAKEDHTKDASKPPLQSLSRQPGWNLDEQLKQVSLSSWGFYLFL